MIAFTSVKLVDFRFRLFKVFWGVFGVFFVVVVVWWSDCFVYYKSSVIYHNNVIKLIILNYINEF